MGMTAGMAVSVRGWRGRWVGRLIDRSDRRMGALDAEWAFQLTFRVEIGR